MQLFVIIIIVVNVFKSVVAIVTEVAKRLGKLIFPSEQPYGYDHQMKSLSLIH